MSEIVTTKKVFTGEVVHEGKTSDYDGKRLPKKVTFTIGAEAANVINVALQLQDADGDNIAHSHYLNAYLSSDAAGGTLEGTGPDSIAVGTDGVWIASGGDSVVAGAVVTEADGSADLDLTKAAGADTFYLCVEINGRLYVSDAITFAA